MTFFLFNRRLGRADATTVAKDETKEKQRILVATDVSDNYVMILNTADDKFAANEKTIDEIWGSFEMWSGGASQNLFLTIFNVKRKTENG